MWAAIIVLAVVALGAIGVALWLLFANSNPDSSAQNALVAQSAEANTEKEEELSVTAEQEAAQQKLEREEAERKKIAEEEKEQEEAAAALEKANQNLYPAPANAVSASYFVTPSGNIGCELSSVSAVCTIYEHSFDPGNSGQCSASKPVTIVLDTRGVQFDCNQASVPGGDGPPLEYNTSATMGTFACHSTVDGLTCWDTNVGSAFAVSKEGFTTGNTGAVPQSRFPWR